MAVQQSPVGFVSIKEEVYLKIAEAVLTYANPNKMAKEQFREVFGFLGGRVVVGNCKVTECQVAHVGENEEVQLEPKHYVEAVEFENQLLIKKPPEFMVGWWHSHFIGHEYSGIDLINHLGWQNAQNPYAIGLVFDPQLISEKNPGFIILNLEDPTLGEASVVQSIDFVVQMAEKYRDDYLMFLKGKFPKLF